MKPPKTAPGPKAPSAARARLVAATEFKAKCLDLMDRVAERREIYTVTKHGKPVAQLAPVPAAAADSIVGCLRGQAWEIGEILSPVLPPEAWDASAPARDARRASPRRSLVRKARARQP